MFVDQAGGLWLSAPVGFGVALGAVLLVLWAESGLAVGRLLSAWRAAWALSGPVVRVLGRTTLAGCLVRRPRRHRVVCPFAGAGRFALRR
jgi:hypothetical protein